MQENEVVLAAGDGFQLSVYHWRADPPVAPRAYVHLVHGMAEHAARYRHVAAELVQRGYEVWASDLRGHGKTAARGQEGHFADHDGWRVVVDDLQMINQWIKGQAAASALPLYMLGHSMGSFLTLSYLMRYGAEVQGAVLSGSNAASPYVMQLARLVPWLEAKRLGWQGRSALVNFLSFGSFNKRFRPTRTDFDWLSRDAAAVDRYCADPLCGFHCSNRLWFDMLGGLASIYQGHEQRKIPADLPLLIIGGEDDPVSAGGGLQRLALKLQQANLQQVTLKIYPKARHEVFNEINRAEVVADMVRWLDERPVKGKRPASRAKAKLQE